MKTGVVLAPSSVASSQLRARRAMFASCLFLILAVPTSARLRRMAGTNSTGNAASLPALAAAAASPDAALPGSDPAGNDADADVESPPDAITTIAATTLATRAKGLSPKGGWDSKDTEDILPWILVFGLGLIIVWLGWMCRNWLNRRFCGGDQNGSQQNDPVHWQWISTAGNPGPVKKPKASAEIGADPDPGAFSILIGGDQTPNTGMTPIPSQAVICPSENQLSRDNFDHLLNRVCNITDQDLRAQTFDMTFDNILLGEWTRVEWGIFSNRLFKDYPGGVDALFQPQNAYNAKQTVMEKWLEWRTLEKADMRDIYEALEAADKGVVAKNAAVNVTLGLRQSLGRITSECVDVLSECSEQMNEETMDIDDDDDEVTPTNSVRGAPSPHRRQHRPSQRSTASGGGGGNAADSALIGLRDRLLVNIEADQSSASNSPGRQGSFNSDHQDTVHSTEQLIHV